EQDEYRPLRRIAAKCAEVLHDEGAGATVEIEHKPFHDAVEPTRLVDLLAATAARDAVIRCAVHALRDPRRDDIQQQTVAPHLSERNQRTGEIVAGRSHHAAGHPVTRCEPTAEQIELPDEV